MQIVLNGRRHDLARPVSIEELLAELDLDSERVAVEVNRRILTRASFDRTRVGDGDEVEIVTFVGGG